MTPCPSASVGTVNGLRVISLEVGLAPVAVPWTDGTGEGRGQPTPGQAQGAARARAAARRWACGLQAVEPKSAKGQEGLASWTPAGTNHHAYGFILVPTTLQTRSAMHSSCSAASSALGSRLAPLAGRTRSTASSRVRLYPPAHTSAHLRPCRLCSLSLAQLHPLAPPHACSERSNVLTSSAPCAMRAARSATRAPPPTGTRRGRRRPWRRARRRWR